MNSGTQSSKLNAGHFHFIPIGFVVGLFAFAVYCTSLLFVDYTSRDDVFFGADHAHTAEKIEKQGVAVGRKKRPLFGLLAGSAYVVLRKLHMPAKGALAIVFGVIGSIAVWLMYFVQHRFFCAQLDAALVALCYALAFSNVVMFGISESYSLSAVFVLLIYLLIFELKSKNLHRPLVVGLSSGIAGWTNPVAMFPLATYVSMLLSTRPSLQKFGQSLAACMTAVIVGVAPLVFAMWFYPHFLKNKTKGIASPKFDYGAISNALADFFFFAIVSPFDTVRHYYVALDVSGYISSPLRLIALTTWITVFVYAVLKALRSKEDLVWMLAVVILPIALLVSFYTWINPQEVMLYTTFGLIPLFLLIGKFAQDSKLVRPALIVLLAVLGLANIAPLYRTDPTVVSESYAPRWHRSAEGWPGTARKFGSRG